MLGGTYAHLPIDRGEQIAALASAALAEHHTTRQPTIATARNL
jgi:hypothetical protein